MNDEILNKTSRARAYKNQKAPMPSLEGTQDTVLEPGRELPRRKYAKQLHSMLQDNDLEDAVEAIRRGLKAKKSYWDGVAKRMVEESDLKVQLDAAKTVLAYREGVPVHREVLLSETFESLKKQSL